MFSPSYVSLHQSGELSERITAARSMQAPCQLCPHRCGVDRLRGEQGICRMSDQPKVASWNLHHWEEPPISGSNGSGTIFFSGCTGRCRFCQNYPISQLGHGQLISVDQLAEMMLELQHKGAHNINLVTPTHFMPQILAALPKAIKGGLRLPLVYNTSGYERVEALRLLEGIVDIWLPDAKYADSAIARKHSGLGDYVNFNRLALLEICRQVGTGLIVDGDGLARRGMIVRHLVLPGELGGSSAVLRWLASHISPQVHVSLLDQYFPAHLAVGEPILGRKITMAEYTAVLDVCEAVGLENGWRQTTTEEAP